jgi:DNA polymerase-3 subunit gamma/tau
VPFEDTVLPLVARAGAGSARDSLSVLDQLLAGSDASGLSYERAVALLGFTDASLLDEIVDAFAGADGAAVFGVVNRVIEGGHEPRRFAADLLDRLRDLIILAAVPHAAQTGLLDLPADRAERMAAQAGRFGQAGLARAAEIVSTSLDQMRGATSPRLLLELMCAQVLLPAATTDEKSLLARLERLESGGLGTPVPRPAAPPSPPHSGTNDSSERPRVPAPPDRTAATPAGPVAPPPASTPPARPAPASASTPPGRAPAEPVGVPRAGASQASVPPAASGASADSLQQNWAAVLDAVKRERRVAWILLSNASVLSLEDGVLTLGFPRDGDLKGFSTSGCDADLKRVLSSGFGLNVTVKGVTGVDPGAGPAGGPARSGGGPGPVAASDPVASAQPRSRPRHDEPPPDDLAPDDIERDEFAPDDGPPDEPDEPDGGPAPVVTELTGMDLIQRELGGQVIGEIED